MGAFPADAGLLHAAERRGRVGDQPRFSPIMPASSASYTRSPRLRSRV